MDFLPASSIRIDDRWQNMYWKSGQRILKAARFIKENPHLYAIYIGNFSCGPDSFILKYFNEEMSGKPFLQIEIDEHSADAGAITRCEAFLDSIENIKDRETLSVTRNAQKNKTASRITHHASRTVFIPRIAHHSYALAAAFERCGVQAEVLPESDKEAVDIGRRYLSGKECYPCTVTTGDMLKKAFSPDFRRKDSAFFMPSGTGPCRFGQYNVLHKMILDEAGFNEVPIFSPNQDIDLYKDLSILIKPFSSLSF